MTKMIEIRIKNVDLNQQYFDYLRQFLHNHFEIFQQENTVLYLDNIKVMEVYMEYNIELEAPVPSTWYNHEYLTSNNIKYLPWTS